MKTLEISISQIQDLVDVYMNTFNNSNWNENWKPTDTEMRIADIINTPGFIGLSAMDKDQIVGMVLGNIHRYSIQNHYYLQEMCVIPDYRNKGVGSFLVSELQNLLTKKDVEKIYLLTERESLAENFYSKNGFYKSNKIQLLEKPFHDKTVIP
ncbi:GNAT family N-acetyltransferase [Chitinispirillales bacterium ANBcel5]|uniref:GNAT family N-acetyltransferase n=1 Tax=Cellulosispirillum alkaliphilum TaxID=3039283 RepID=UPI002A57DF2C|nr:GNAT family N-acetyltransferase [Chitinispirillales bacterium ANBcel5]